MTRFEDYDERDLAEVVFDEVPFVREAFQEYTRDREEYNEDAEYYRVPRRQQGYDFSLSYV